MTPSPHILVVDDNPEICGLLSRYLAKHGFRVTTATDGKAMRRVIDESRIDLIVLDLMLPGDDGLTLCRELRAKSPIPIVMLTAMGEETDRVVGLEMGADDYVTKPFSARELLARIKAVLRRAESFPPSGPSTDSAILKFENWRFNPTKRELESSDGVLVPLSSNEFNLLLTFVQHPQRVLSRDQLLDLTKGRGASPFDRSIDTQVSRLRRKLNDDSRDPRIIKTVWGGGYVFTPVIEHP